MTEAEIDKGMRLIARNAQIIIPALQFILALTEHAHELPDDGIEPDMSKRN
jgi:hypothetical protein